MQSAFTIPSFLFLSLFLVGLVPNAKLDTATKKMYPPFWDQVSGEITEFPVKDNKTIINMWNYTDRLRMYKILITQTNKYFVQFGSNNSGNVLWALALTYGKLYKTGRFSDPSNVSVCAYDAVSPSCVSFNSGWGGTNFFVIVLNFLAAVESKFLNNVSHEILLLPPENHKHDFCFSLEECRKSFPHAMDAAKEFYQYLQSITAASTVNSVSVYNTSEDRATLLLWKAYRAAVETGLSKFSDVSWYSSVPERKFAMDILTLMEFCETTTYRTNFKNSKAFLVGFPHRQLKDGEDKIQKTDFKMREKAFLASTKFISNLNKMTGGWFLVAWKLTVESSELHHVLGNFFINTLLLIPIIK
ncbi:protein LEG1 homolog [Peromyscus leucopus]|uniref:protein LEG1 homolog n=1 Tax=Peromyscus leucopus TaxID=10041 RepID=UPI001884DCA6|nr:protein LEG1 homolog [Peromyscus leucopus]